MRIIKSAAVALALMGASPALATVVPAPTPTPTPTPTTPGWTPGTPGGCTQQPCSGGGGTTPGTTNNGGSATVDTVVQTRVDVAATGGAATSSSTGGSATVGNVTGGSATGGSVVLQPGAVAPSASASNIGNIASGAINNAFRNTNLTLPGATTPGNNVSTDSGCDAIPVLSSTGTVLYVINTGGSTRVAGTGKGDRRNAEEQAALTEFRQYCFARQGMISNDPVARALALRVAFGDTAGFEVVGRNYRNGGREVGDLLFGTEEPVPPAAPPVVGATAPIEPVEVAPSAATEAAPRRARRAVHVAAPSPDGGQ